MIGGSAGAVGMMKFQVQDRRAILRKKGTSLDAFKAKSSSRIGQNYLFYSKDLRKDGDVALVLAFMGMLL